MKSPGCIAWLVAVLWMMAGCEHFQPQPLDAARSWQSFEARSLADPGLEAFARSERGLTGTWPPGRWTVRELGYVAQYFHPSLEVARAQWHLAEAGLGSAGGRPNPTVGVTPGYSLNPAAGASPWFPGLTVDFPVETAGKRSFRIAQARALLEAARLNLDTAAWRVRSQLGHQWLEHAAAEERESLLREHVELQKQYVALLEERLAVGAISAGELVAARLARAKSDLELADAERRVAEGRVRLAEALGLPARAIANAQLEREPMLAASGMGAPIPVGTRERALTTRSDLMSALAEYAAAQCALQGEIAKQYPDVHLGTGYQFDQSEHKWSLGLTAEIPVLNRNQGPIREAKSRREEAAARFLALQASIGADVEAALVACELGRKQSERHAVRVRLAQEQRNAAEAQLRAGAVDRLEALTAHIAEGSAELDALDARILAAQAVARLEEVLQVPVERWPEPVPNPPPRNPSPSP